MVKRYIWRGINPQGQSVTGEVVAENQTIVKISLLQQGIKLLDIRKKTVWTHIFQQDKITKQHIYNFTQQLKNLIDAGIAILPALNIICENLSNVSLHLMLEQLKSQIASGHTLSAALKNYSAHFDNLYCSLIAAGEQTGQLTIILENITEYQEKMQELRRKINKAIFYPAVVVVVATAITLFLCLFIVPQFAAMFASFGAQLPLLTRLVVGIANALRYYGWALLLLTILSGVGVNVGYKKNMHWRLWLDSQTLRIPFIGKILQTAILARCLHTLAIALKAGVVLPAALAIAAEVADKHKYRFGMLQIQHDIIAGERLHQAMRQTNLFTPEMIQMIALSEETGTLAVMLQKISKQAGAKVDAYLDSLTKLLEPAIMFILSVVVGGLILAMYLPIFQLGGVV